VSRAAPATEPLLTVDDLRVELPAGGRLRPAVDGMRFALFPGEAVAVVGESGSGKTQLARALLGLSPEGARVSGRIAYSGRTLNGLDERSWGELRGREIGLVFQEPAAALDPVRTIGAQIEESIRLAARSPLSRSQARAAARAALAEVAFPDPDSGLDAYPHRLSGGMRQRAHLAAVLAANPKLLHRLRRERDLTLLLITHDLGIVAEHSDRVLVVYAGRIVEEAATPDLFRSPQHPYTRGLLRSIPLLAEGARAAGGRYDAIPGSLPDLSEREAGACAFAPRCPERFELCTQREPDPYATPTGLARCFLHEKEK
jgi:peptide/nickel transport system ATP-binding protein